MVSETFPQGWNKMTLHSFTVVAGGHMGNYPWVQQATASLHNTGT